MRTLFRLFVRYHFLLLFLLFEGFSIWLIARSNYYQRAQFGSLTRTVFGNVTARIDKIAQYFDLLETNRQIVKENIELRHQLTSALAIIEESDKVPTDTLLTGRFSYIPARIISNSVNRQYNSLLLNVGERHGVNKEMGVVTTSGVVGVVTSVSNNYSSVISLLNVDLRVSARVKKNRFFGSLYWDGKDYRHAQLADIPIHIDVALGDTIVTSGFSSIFPPDLTLGTVVDVENTSGNFLKIRVVLTNDFRKLDQVWVVRNNYLNEEKIIGQQ